MAVISALTSREPACKPRKRRALDPARMFATVSFALCCAAYGAGCGEIASPKLKCPAGDAVGFSGRWVGTLGTTDLTLDLHEECRTYFGLDWQWYVVGTFGWGNVTGTVEGSESSEWILWNDSNPRPFGVAGGVRITDRARSADMNTFTATVSGSWRELGDPARIIATFDTVGVRLNRR
jgi:hypothetical protein